jgi:hypothetical protein
VQFEDLNNTAITLFALLNGDDIRCTYTSHAPTHAALGID